jgi:GAF domain-containing protein
MIHVPPDEMRRLDALRRLRFEAGLHVPVLDNIAKVAVRHFHVPTAMVSLVDATRQTFAGRDGTTMTGTPIGHAFCRITVQSDDVLVVEDALLDTRFCTSPLVTGEPGIRFYAGAPLITADGIRVGAACIVDRVPRSLNVGQKVVLRELAKIAVAELEERAARMAQLDRIKVGGL